MLLRHERLLLAIDLMLDIAFHAGRADDPTGAPDIAERLGLSRRSIEPVLQALARADLLDSVRGPRGGYRLGRPARSIAIDDILAAVHEEDGPPAETRGALSDAVTVPLWAEFEAAGRRNLAAVTLEDLLRRAAAKGFRRAVEEPIDFAI
jgi:Rrf2 family iron-sulfur cluster assembly transcriptional regulator